MKRLPHLIVLMMFLSLGLAMLAVSAWAQPAGSGEPWKAPARASRRPNPVPSDEKSIAAGKALYTAQCMACHGTTGKGDGPAAKDLGRPVGDLSSPAVWKETDGDLFWKITTGRSPMPSFENILSDQQRWEVVNYIRTLAPKPAATQP